MRGSGEVHWAGLAFATHRDVYEPAEDSFLLAEASEEAARPGTRALDLGCGTGIAALAIARAGARVVAVDANPRACALAAANARRNGLPLDVVRGDLADALAGRFDLVVANPPYLPADAEATVRGPLEAALTGGATGAEVARRIVADLPRLLLPGGVALVVTSSRGAEESVLADARALGFEDEALGEERFFFERLTVRRFSRRTGSGPGAPPRGSP